MPVPHFMIYYHGGLTVELFFIFDRLPTESDIHTGEASGGIDVFI